MREINSLGISAEMLGQIYKKSDLYEASSAFAEHMGHPMLSQRTFEEGLSVIVENSNVLATNSGTSALHLALRVLGIGQGDEVICPTFTFVAVANAIRYVNARPVFVGIEENSLNISVEHIKDVINNRLKRNKPLPKAIIAVHAFGIPFNVKEIVDLCNLYNIHLIEDAAGALGSRYEGKHVGNYGHIGIFSFNYNKIITTAGGGALISNTLNYVDKARALASQAKITGSNYVHFDLGYNYIMHPMAAELGSVMLKKFYEILNLKQDLYEFYRSELNGKGLEFFDDAHNYRSNKWLIPVTIAHTNIGRERFSEFTRMWYPLHAQKIFNEFDYFGNDRALDIFNKGFCLPNYSYISEDEVWDTISNIKNILADE
ncbi:MAG TPA: DegT/DnrJ/EryC1/StrS family aminotransferase [Fulvivirga sp.]|nr:DegT/DnrJ/EryC1/StrS family aminotransferase [Fulvivirga sp.]